jgi:Domain of unknown function (DUF1707)
MASQPGLRIGDRERDAVASELQEHYAHGRLTLEEFNQRLDAVFAAKTQSDLNQITSDLPHARSWGSLPSGSAASQRRSRPGPGRGVMVTSWAGPAWTGPHAGDHRQGNRRHGASPRGGYGLLLALMSALASWYLVYDVILIGMRWPLPGRIGLLIAIYTIIKGLLRRIFRRRR